MIDKGGRVTSRRAMRLVCVALFLVCATTGRGAAPAAEPSPAAPCPSFKDLGRLVDERVQEIKPGITLEEFTRLHTSQALNFWDEVGSDRETVFFIGATEGNARVSDQLVCRFDKNDRLRSCKRECCRGQSRTITVRQYESLAIGDRRTDVEARLCSPSDVEVDPKRPARVKTYYHIDLPIHHHHEGQTVLLVFENGSLSSKGMSPYY